MIFDKDYYYKNYWTTVDLSYSHAELFEPKLFFKLGLNAIKDRFELIKPFKQAVKEDYENNREEFNKIFKNFNFEKYSTTRKEFVDEFGLKL